MDHQHHKTEHVHQHHHHEQHEHPHHEKETDAKIIHDEHAGHHTENFLKRFWICLLLTIPVLLLSHMIQQWSGFELAFKGDKYVLLVLSSIIYFYGGWPFLTGLIRELKNKVPGMMTLVAVAITTAYIYSVAVVFGFKGM